MSKTILVGIDFSDCSINALEHAITISQKADAKLIMIWINKLENMRSIYPGNSELIADNAQKRLEELMEKYKPLLKPDQLSYVIRNGKVYSEILKATKEFDPFVLIVGTHGSSGFEEFWIGSNANRIVVATKCPVITIRNSIDVKRTISKIVMPIDSTLETGQKVPMTALFAKYFDAEVHILSTHVSSIEEIRHKVRSYAKFAAEYLKENDVRYVINEIDTNNVTDATIEYAQVIDANLITIMDEQETATSNLWLGPFAQQMVNHCPIPVLTVHAKNIIVGLYN